MWKTTTKFMQLCNQIKFPINAISSHITITDVEAIASQIYEQYFKDRVQEVHNVPKESIVHVHDLLNAPSNQKEIVEPTNDDVWIFGYGSLVWKADFPYIDRRRGFIRGYQRRFYQHSIDHRGTPRKPGRVVTLLPTGGNADRVYGVAYRIPSMQKKDVLQHLDHREKNGYERRALEFQEFPEDTGEQFDIIMYIATHENESYAGDVWQLPRIAEQIYTSAGPSGRNREYLFNLANAMRALFPGEHDEHLFELEKLVVETIVRDEAVTLERALKKEIASIIIAGKAVPGNNQFDTIAVIKRLDALEDRCSQCGWKEAFLTNELKYRPSS